jgi:sugar phosphate permease
LLLFTMKDSVAAPATEIKRADKPRFLPAVKELITLPGFLLLGAVSSMAAVAFWIVYTWLPTYLYERFQMSLTGAGFSATFYIQAASFGGILLGGWLADSWSHTNPRARALLVVIGFVAAGIFLFLVGYTSSQAVLCAIAQSCSIAGGHSNDQSVRLRCTP